MMNTRFILIAIFMIPLASCIPATETLTLTKSPVAPTKPPAATDTTVPTDVPTATVEEKEPTPEPVDGDEVPDIGLDSVVPQEVDFPAPELTLKDLDLNPVSLEDYLGTVVLLNNWATWCVPCKEEMPELEAYYQAHKDDGFVIIAVEAGGYGYDIRAFVESAGLTFPIWRDPKKQSLDAFRNKALPNSYVIDRTGTVRLAWTGPIRESMLEKYVTPLLSE